ncbi:MAG: GGDEF domain-containing protein [Clostridia bacterium]|nr:GGDEF domain-containing protein [Clostridia bacterium]
MKKERILGIAFILILVPVLLFVLISSFAHSSLSLDTEKPIDVSHSWTCSIEGKDAPRSLDLPAVLNDIPKNTTIQLTRVLPKANISSPTLFFKTEEHRVKVLFNGSTIYEYSPKARSFGSSPGSAIHLVHLPDNFDNGYIKIILTSPYKQFSGILQQVYLGNRNSHILMLLDQDLLPFALAIAILFEGFVLAFIYVSLRYSKIRNAGILYLAFFSFLAGLWIMCERMLSLLFVPDPVFILNLALISLYCLPIPLLLFIQRTYCPKNPNPLVVLSWAYFGFLLASTLLQLFNLVDYVLVLPVFHALTTVTIAVIGWLGFHEVKSGNKSIKAFFYACTVFGFFILTDILLYYFASVPKMSSHSFFQIGMLGFILVTGSSLGENLFHLREIHIRNDLLLSLAYTDGLTRLKNRRSFDDMIEALNSHLDQEDAIHLIILDINNLKTVNDKLGHSQGDCLILEGVKLLRETLGKLGEIYRIGGDEFCVIIRGMEEEAINDTLSELFEKIDRFNSTAHMFSISIAYGMAAYQKGVDTALNSVFVRADRAMYVCKDNQKQIRVIG